MTEPTIAPVAKDSHPVPVVWYTKAFVSSRVAA